VAHHNKVFGLETKAQRLEKEKALVMYEGLKQQLNPHFLFNSLTALNSLILKDQHTARNFLERLSDTFRYILKNRDRELVGLAEELAFAETYIQLQKTRFRETLQVHINVSEEYAGHKIVPVTIQNLVENATKHNILDNESPLVIDIFTRDGYIIVQNNLQKKKIVETSNKQGLRNLKTLYSYLTDHPVIIEDTGEAFAVHIPLIS
jgi:LytS/YehU family sensor histidine kinase